MRKTLDNYIFNPLCLKVAFLIFSVLYCIPPIMEKVDLLFNVVLIWGMLAVIYEVFFHKTYFSDNFYILAFLACIFYFGTFLLNGHHLIDLKVLFYIGIDLFLFTTNRVGDDRCTKMTEEIRILSRIFVGITAVIAVLSLATYILDISIVYRNSVTSVPLVLGVHANGSLYGLIGNSNRHAWLCLISLTLTFWLLSKKKSKWLCANVLVQTVVILLSQSRGAFIGLGILLVGSLILFVHGHKRAPFARYKSILICSVLLVASVFTVLGATTLAKNTGIQATAQAQVGTLLKKTQQQTDDSTVRTEQEKKDNVSARLEMYTAGLQMLTDKPAFGFGANELDETTRTYLATSSNMNQKGFANNFHNIFLQTAVQGGILQMLVLLAMLVYGLAQAIRAFRTKTVDPSCAYLIIGLFSLLAINMVESEIYMARSFSAGAFWMIYGYCLRYFNPTGKSKILLRKSKAAGE